MPRLLAIPLLLALIVLAAPVAANTPGASPADACTVDPRTRDDIDRLYGQITTPTSGDGLEPYVIAESALPVGEPADDTAVSEITDLLTIRTACLRNLDALRFYALYTDCHLVDLFSIEGYPDWIGLPATPAGGPAGPPDYRLGSIDQPLLLEDGRVSAFVTFVGADVEDSHPRPGVTYLMIFQRVDGAWRIDRQYTDYIDSTRQLVHPIADLLDDLATRAA